ncbi:MAG: hypothetical protein U0556_07520 [Dehalococcoidia bacterium]
MSIREWLDRVKDTLDPEAEIKQDIASGSLHGENVDEYVDGVHLRHSQMFGEDAPSRQDWYDYIYGHLEGDMRNT